MNYHQTRRYIDKLKKERDYAEYVKSEIKKRGDVKAGEYQGASERAQVLNNLMRHRGE